LGGLTEAMPAVEQRAPGHWQIGTVQAIKRETPHVKSFRIALPMWMPHLPGQHYEVRLTAPDGYSAQRSYSIASSPLDEGEIELTIDRLEDGEVSPYFDDVLEDGDQVELRGPFTSYFVWRGERPVLLVGGGSGVVPLMAMLRHRRLTMPDLPMLLLYSVRHADDVIYADELGEDTVLTFTRDAPSDWSGHRGHIDAGMIADAAQSITVPSIMPGLAFVCGSNGFVESASELLLAAGFQPQQIRTERFGPSG
jgi:ferredoxin-NADP reductase